VSFMPSGSKMRSRKNVSSGRPEARAISTPPVCYIHFSPG
jgi:hypothetical protein